MNINKNNRTFSLIGFCGLQDLISSMLRPRSAVMMISISSIATVVQYLFGLKPLFFVALAILLVVELVTGIAAAKTKGRKLTSRRMQRFGIMVLIWFTLLLVTNALIDQYKGQFEEHIAYYMHTTMIFYILGIYIKSILENAENIWKNKINAKELLRQLFNFKRKDEK